MVPLDSNSHKHSSMQIIQSLEERIYCEVDRRLSQVARAAVKSPSLEIFKTLLVIVLGSWLLVALFEKGFEQDDP